MTSKSLRSFFVVAAVAAACSSSTPAPVPAGEAPAPSSAAPVSVSAASLGLHPVIGSFGFDTAGMDHAVTPGASFFGYASGTWAKTTEIPADRASFGMFARLDELSNERTRGIIEEAAAAKAPEGTEAQKVGDFFASFMDEAAIEAAGRAPLAPELAAIAAIKDKTALVRTMATLGRSYTHTPFALYVNNDDKQPDRYVVFFVQSGLGMPDRDYYLSADAKLVEARAKYQVHVANMLRLAGVADPEKKAKAIYELERKIAEAHWTRVDSRDADKTYNKWARADFDKNAPGVDWQAFLAAAGVAAQQELIVAQPSAYAGMAKLVKSEPLATWKDYLTLRAIKGAAPLLSKAFVDEDFDFDSRVLNGTPENKARWKRGVELVNDSMGEAVGKLYVAKYFPPEAKAKADELVRNVIAAMGERLKSLSWMAPETKAKALEKLAAFTPKIGYPDKWRDYSALRVVRGDAYGNTKRAAEFEYQRNLDKLGKPIDRGEWFMPPMQVNAYANPVMNEIVFPAAILQPPFFDPDACPAVNYGAIGAVIGHEISHHFDDQGRKYDAKGALTDWWTPGDVERFKKLTDQLVAQFAIYEPLPGMHINGELTLGENIADLAGLTVAFDAYMRASGGRDPVIEGFTGEQRFFLGWAQVWRTKYREENLRNRLVTDPHSPAEYRAGIVRNLDAWYGAFGPKSAEALHLASEARVRIW